MLFDRNGELLAATIAVDEQWRFPASAALPDKYVSALVAFEDRRFYQHVGVDPVSIARAIQSNWAAGRVVSGGSTITMQLARMLRGDPPRNLSSKVIEAFMALQLEWHFDKTQLLKLYASHAPFGGNNVGLDAASWRYFLRPPGDLSWAEAALLAVLPNSPSLMHPGLGRERLLAKRDRLLARLYKQKYLSDGDYRLALLEPLPAKPKPLPRLASHRLQTLSQQNPQQSQWNSSLEAAIQRQAQAVADIQGRRLAREGVQNLSLLVIDNRTLTFSAYVGNHTEQGVAASVDIASKPRSSGSILKPLLYAAALDAGQLLPETLIADIPSVYDGFSPENYDRDYRGAVPARQALVQSLNIPSVRMLHSYGVDRFYQDLQALGVSSLFRPAEDYGLSLILGGAETRLDELTLIYAQLMAQARDGQQAIFPFSQGAAWLTLEATADVSRPGAEQQWRDYAEGDQRSSREIAWKTGTSYGLRDAWAIGSNSHYTVGVWAGNAGGEGVPGLTGLASAAPVMLQMFERLGRSQWLQRPEHALKQLSICADDGYLVGGSDCEATQSWAPLNSHFQQQTPHHQRVNLDASGQHRVHSECESVANIQSRDFLVLSPQQQYYWRQHHADYRRLPPWRSDCVAALADISDDTAMEIIYPNEGSTLYIPIELDGERGQTVLKATHRNRRERLYWHLDDEYLGATELYHQQPVDIALGWHKLTLVDQLGSRLERWFKVVGKSEQ